ncbi:exopolysaccharide production repressor protein [Pararhizobium capsulatum DSM 1112]|uniref:Exopolysaccharide production repressor protein n=1 Tax=Pararhizobium capsulatum DSM 1112 TaxID=1121113 RepID=A0ABU0BX25_9HYPH|nr:exopolysaccharide production repressor protein [Pararhizobium capsulatum]MDQ0322502.1 exopolysaccharide production repressor protein [Pararhizobium capsulatum DSM 1112]
MYGPRVFVSMIGALLVFAIATYAMNGSLGMTLLQTAMCAVLLQVGYFLGVLFLVWKTARDGQLSRSEQSGSAKSGDGDAGASAIPVSRLNKPGHPNF